MAKPLRFRYSPERWTEGRVRSELLGPLDANLGAAMRRPWFAQPEGFEARRFEMDNGDVALFCWREARSASDGATGRSPGAGEAYWLGNTETPSTLWRTDKRSFDEAPAEMTAWAERELLAQLHEEDPWFADYPALSWYFLPVFLSKDGRDSTRTFFRERAAGFPDADPAEAAAFVDAFLESGALDDYRHTMAGKLGTSPHVDEVRMSAAIGEFLAAKLLSDSGYDLTPEIEVTTGHSLDFRADPRDGGEATLVEVTRPQPTSGRAASGPVQAVRETAETKTSGQLDRHGGGVTLFVDCSSFPDDDWAAVLGEQPEVRHRPAVVFRMRPDGRVEGYTKGSVPLSLAL